MSDAPKAIRVKPSVAGDATCGLWVEVGSAAGGTKYIRDDLVAAKDAEIDELERQLAEAREVKPLEWAGPRGSTGKYWAGTSFGLHYVVTERGWGYRNAPDQYPVEGGIEAAKAAAQADYASRILSALKDTRT